MNDSSKNEWYKSEQYSDSIYNVIANAIADCKLRQNEFRQPEPKDGIVEFEAMPDKVGYTGENWNASVLWNFLAEAINNSLNTEVKDKFSKECIKAVGARIAKYYTDIEGIEDLVNKAVNDIKEYAAALGLYDYLSDLHSSGRKYHKSIKLDEQDGVKIIKIEEANVKDEEDIRHAPVQIEYTNKDRVIYGMRLRIDKYKHVKLNNKMIVEKKIDGRDPIYACTTEQGLSGQEEEYIESRAKLYAVVTALGGSNKFRELARKIHLQEQEMELNKKASQVYIIRIMRNIWDNELSDLQQLKELERHLMRITPIINDLYKEKGRSTDERIKLAKTILNRDEAAEQYEQEMPTDIITGKSTKELLKLVLRAINIELDTLGLTTENIYSYNLTKNKKQQKSEEATLTTIRRSTIMIKYKSTEELAKQIQMTLGTTNDGKKQKRINGTWLKEGERIETDRIPLLIIAEIDSQGTTENNEIEIPAEIEIKTSGKMLRYNECGEIGEGEASEIVVWSKDSYDNWEQIYSHKSKDEKEEEEEEENERVPVVMIYELDDGETPKKEEKPD